MKTYKASGVTMEGNYINTKAYLRYEVAVENLKRLAGGYLEEITVETRDICDLGNTPKVCIEYY